MASQALKSKDLAEVKKSRATVKGQITTGVRKLEPILEKLAGNDFDHKNISRAEVTQLHSKVEENFQLFQKLHVRCNELREEETLVGDEEKVVLKEEEYSDETSSKVFPLLDKYVMYDRFF